MSRRRLSLPRLLGLGHDEPPAHADEPVEEFLDPYTVADIARDRREVAQYVRGVAAGREEEQRLAADRGRQWRRTWSTEPVIAAKAEAAVEGRVSPGSRPLTLENSQAGVQAWKGAVR